MILKVLVGFLLGFILGVAGTVFLVASGAGNYLIATNPRVQELEAKVRDAESQRAFVTRRLEEVANLTERMATRFEELQGRFEALERVRPGTLGTPGPRGGTTESGPPEVKDKAPGAPAGNPSGE
jgi:hypothetical protein